MWQSRFFFTNEIFLYKASLEACFLERDSCSLTDRLNKVRTILKTTWLITLPDNTNVKKSLEMTLNSKHRTEKLKTKNHRYRNTKNQNTERRKPSFTKWIGRKCRLILTRTEKNNEHARIMYKIQFRLFYYNFNKKRYAL